MGGQEARQNLVQGSRLHHGEQGHRMAGIPVPVFVVGALIGFVWMDAFYFSNDVAFKRKYFRASLIAMDCLLIGLAIVLNPGLAVFLPFAVLFAALSTAWTIWVTTFCDSCGRTIVHHQLLDPLLFCASCGARLTRPR